MAGHLSHVIVFVCVAISSLTLFVHLSAAYKSVKTRTQFLPHVYVGIGMNEYICCKLYNYITGRKHTGATGSSEKEHHECQGVRSRGSVAGERTETRDHGNTHCTVLYIGDN